MGQSVIPAITATVLPWMFFPSSSLCVHSLMDLYSPFSEADTAGQAETNWSREKQISVSQCASPNLLALRRVSNRRSNWPDPSNNPPADGWEIIATICRQGLTHIFTHASPLEGNPQQSFMQKSNFLRVGQDMTLFTSNYCCTGGSQLARNSLWKEAGMRWLTGDQGIMKGFIE